MAVNNEKSKPGLGAHQSRWLMAIVLLVPTLFSILSDQYIFFFILMLLAGGATWWEFSRNLLGGERTGLLCLAMAGWGAVATGSYFLGPVGQSYGLVVALALGAAYTMWGLGREDGQVLVNLMSRYSFGHLYLSFLMSFFLLLKKTGPEGGKWLVYLLVVTIAADTGAYYAGNKFKGAKLWPKISPNKTRSGLAGGVVASMLLSAVCATFIEAPAAYLVPMGFFLGLWGAVGDLFESTIKRAINIKDSSTLLMGHGGFWDRLDSLLFNVVPVYILADYIAAP